MSETWDPRDLAADVTRSAEADAVGHATGGPLPTGEPLPPGRPDAVNDADEQRQRAELKDALISLWLDRAHRYRLAWQSARRRAWAFSSAWAAASQDTGGLVGGLRRQLADRDARIAELRAELERERLDYSRLGAERDDLRRQLEAESDAQALLRDELRALREAVARVRAWAQSWVAHTDPGHTLQGAARDILAALDGTDGGDRD